MYQAFHIESNPADESEFWYGVYGADNLLLPEPQRIHAIVPVQDADKELKRLEAKYGVVTNMGTTNDACLLGVNRWGNVDKAVIKMEMDKQFRPEEYTFDQTEMAKFEALPDTKEDMLDRVEGMEFMPHPMKMAFLKLRREEEEARLATIDRFEANNRFQKLMLKDNKEEITEALESQKNMARLTRIQTRRNEM